MIEIEFINKSKLSFSESMYNYEILATSVIFKPKEEIPGVKEFIVPLYQVKYIKRA